MKEKLLLGKRKVSLVLSFVLVFAGINVLPIRADAASYSYITSATSGVKSHNYWGHDYGYWWSQPINSYLIKNEQGGFIRVEYKNGSTVYVENWSTDFKLQSSKRIKKELPIFGGFYSGKDNNYIVFGQRNLNEKDSVEVLRVVKYSKNWVRLGQCSVYGANTQIPLEAGSLRMAEAGGRLIVHTCHTMYASSDGLNHQSNMIIFINENTMEQVNIKNPAYVSHSFNQFVLTDEEALYFLDHGDAYPREVVLTKSPINNEYSSSRVKIHAIGGSYKNNKNATGLCLGGMIMAKDKILVVGSSVNQKNTNWSEYAQSNIFVTITDKNLSAPVIRQITNYNESSKIYINNPYIVKATDEISYVIWGETNREDDTVIKVARINNNSGNVEYCSQGIFGELSDCEPLYIDGNLVWYTTDFSYPQFYKLNTSRLDSYTWVKPTKKQVKMPVGKKIKKGKAIYKVIGQNTVEYVKAAISGKNISIPSSVTIKNKKYQVVSIAAGAFKNNKKVQKIIIPRTIKRIGSKAFFGCKNLKNIIIKSKFLSSSSIGKNALTGVSQKVKVKVPKKQYKKYKKLLRKKGLSKKAIIKK